MEKVKVVLDEEKELEELASLGIILPSDSRWRTDNYFRLVELHRTKTDNHRKVSKALPRKLFQKGFPALGLWALKSSERQIFKLPLLTVDSEPVINWNDHEMIKASQVLTHQEYSHFYKDINPDRMRKILGLVYDVLRYKQVLGEVLEDVGYFCTYKDDISIEEKVWLLLYDMICRGFRERKYMMAVAELRDFEIEGLHVIHEKLWGNKIKIAAAVARIRIRKQARSLSDLLPRRIRHPSKIVSNPIVEGWLNIYRIPYQEIEKKFKKIGLTRHVGREALPPLTFSEDHLLPYHFYCRPFTRSTFLTSAFIKKNEFIVQSRAHCLSAAIISEVMKTNELVGSVAQTEIVALPASGYIAAVLSLNQQLTSHLLIFGAGEKKELYETYFKQLGVWNVFIISEKFCELDPQDPRLESVVLVLACPPSSNSSVQDPVDLSISRGGDISILRQLTSKTDADNQPHGSTTEAQRHALRRALSLPQVQGVVYETFSEFTAENSSMVTSVVEEMNMWAAQKHLRETVTEFFDEIEFPVADVPPAKEIQVHKLHLDNVPLCDLFELSPLPDICPHEKNCLKLETEGVYIGLIMRKKITRLDSKFMISMAEERGLFGSGNKDSTHDLEKVISEERPSSSNERRLPLTKVNMKRISAPTFCSKLKNVRNYKLSRCERSKNGRRLTISRIWWNALLGHIKFLLKRRVSRIKFYFPRRNKFYSKKRKRSYHLSMPEITLYKNNGEKDEDGKFCREL